MRWNKVDTDMDALQAERDRLRAAANAVIEAWGDYAACEDYDAVEAAVGRLRELSREQSR